MKKMNVGLVLAAVCVLGILSYRGIRAQETEADAVTAPPAAAGLDTGRIAVVNVAKVLRECQENLEREKRTTQRRQQVKASMDQLAAEADALGKELEQALEPGTKQYTDTLQQYFDKRALYEAYGKGQEKAVEVESKAWLEDIYQRLLKQVGSVARKKEITLVFNLDQMPIEGRELAELYNMVLARAVLYNTPSMDITAEVLEAMDAEYDLIKQQAQ